MRVRYKYQVSTVLWFAQYLYPWYYYFWTTILLHIIVVLVEPQVLVLVLEVQHFLASFTNLKSQNLQSVGP